MIMHLYKMWVSLLLNSDSGVFIVEHYLVVLLIAVFFIIKLIKGSWWKMSGYIVNK